MNCNSLLRRLYIAEDFFVTSCQLDILVSASETMHNRNPETGSFPCALCFVSFLFFSLCVLRDMHLGVYVCRYFMHPCSCRYIFLFAFDL